jgi:hypothetical protein
VIEIRLEYSGMRATRSAPDMPTAIAQAADMFDNHGIDRTTIVGDAAAPDRGYYWRGRVRTTGARAIVRFIGGPENSPAIAPAIAPTESALTGERCPRCGRPLRRGTRMILCWFCGWNKPKDLEPSTGGGSDQ